MKKGLIRGRKEKKGFERKQKPKKKANKEKALNMATRETTSKDIRDTLIKLGSIKYHGEYTKALDLVSFFFVPFPFFVFLSFFLSLFFW